MAFNVPSWVWKVLQCLTIVGAAYLIYKKMKGPEPIAPKPGDIVYTPTPAEGAERNNRIANSILDKLRRKK